MGIGQDRAPGRFVHGPLHPGVPLAQRKEQRERSGDSTIIHRTPALVLPVLPCSPCGAAAHLGKQNAVASMFLEMQLLDVGTHGSFIEEVFAQHSVLDVHILEEK